MSKILDDVRTDLRSLATILLGQPIASTAWKCGNLALAAMEDLDRYIRGDGWIACSERMPEPRAQAWLLRHGRPIIGCREPAEYTLPDRWVGNGNTYWLDTGGVTHWSPLPAAPPSAGETKA